jgi:polysaccharide lyase-like protein
MSARRTPLVLAAALLLVAGIAPARAGARAHRAPATWHGLTVANRWAGWAQRQLARGDATAVREQGLLATAYTVHPGDRAAKGGERAEVAASVRSTGAIEGRATTYSWATWFPDAFVPAPHSSWNVFTQLHDSSTDHCPPNLALQVDTQHGDERLRLSVRGGPLTPGTCVPAVARTWDFAQLQRDRWYRFGLAVGWSAGARKGYVRLTLNGRVVVPRTALPTLYPGQGAYLKQGFYRQASPFATTVVHSAVTRGPIVRLPVSRRGSAGRSPAA